MCSNSINVFFILFYRPTKVDECDTCTEIKQSIKATPENKVQLQAELDKHNKESDIQVAHLSAREQSCPLDDKEAGNTWLTIATDLQQTQPVPKLSNQSSFYKKKVRFPIRFIFFYKMCCINLNSKYFNSL